MESPPSTSPKSERFLQHEISRVSEKLHHLENQHQKLQRRQDTIDSLALDTLFKMELLLGKMKTVRNFSTVANSQTALPKGE